MSEYYGYDPSKYANDFSWIGDVGKYVGQFATQMPELLEANKQIKENNKFKDVSFAASNKFIDRLSNEQVTKIASSMGLDYETPEQAKSSLRKMIPQYSDKATNEEYAGQIVNSFFAPVMQHAMSNKAGVPLSVGDILNMVNSGSVQNAMLQSPAGQEYSTNKAMQTKVDLENKNAYGEGADLSQGTFGYQQDAAKKSEQEQFDLNRNRSKQSGDIINQGQQNIENPKAAFDAVIAKGGTKEEAQAAFNNTQTMVEEKRQDRESRARLASQRISNKELSALNPDVFPDMMREVATVVGSINDDISKLKANQSNKNQKLDEKVFRSRLADLTNQKMIAEANQKGINYSYKYYLNNSDKTKKGGIEAQRVGQATAQSELEMNNPKPLPGQNTESKKYEQTNWFDTFIQDVKDQMSKTGTLDKETKGYLDYYLRNKGISQSQFFQSIGVGGSSSSSTVSNSGRFNQTTIDAVDWKEIARAKAVLAKPDSPEWMTQKQQAKLFLDSQKISY